MATSEVAAVNVHGRRLESSLKFRGREGVVSTKLKHGGCEFLCAVLGDALCTSIKAPLFSSTLIAPVRPHFIEYEQNERVISREGATALSDMPSEGHSGRNCQMVLLASLLALGLSLYLGFEC
jgi:hypothetical protein